MTDHSSRSKTLARLSAPLAPSDTRHAARFATLSLERQRQINRAALDPARATADPDPTLVRAVAEAHAQRVWPIMTGSFVTAVLVLMTIWGFGRSVFPARAPLFLLAGGVAGLVTLQVGARRLLKRLARAREVHEILSHRRRDDR